MELPVNYDKLTRAERREVRLEYINQQNGDCYHCGVSLSDSPCSSIQALTIFEDLFPKGFFNHPVHLHHNHDTGMTIGAVHARCNAALWQYHGE